MNEFRFTSSIKLTEITGRRAFTLRELLAGIRELDGSVIFHHTHHFVLSHQHLVPKPPNEFAVWAGEALRERELSERLLGINTVEFGTIRALRDRLKEVIEDHLRKNPRVNPAPPGMEFHFMRTRSFFLPTSFTATDLPSFRDALQKVSLNSVYHHMFEARLRLERGANDFSLWLEQNLGEKELADAISRLDPYSYTLTALRQAITEKVEARLRA